MTFDFAAIPILETERLRLRPLTEADAPEIIRLFSDARVLAYLDLDPPCDTTERAEAMIRWMNDGFAHRGGARWGITLRGSDDRILGTCGFHEYKPKDRRVDIGYDLMPEYWGKGYVTEAARELVRWCFAALDLHRVQADLTEGNLGSQRVLEKLGFTHEGTWRENCFEHGHFVSLKQYGLLRREFVGG